MNNYKVLISYDGTNFSGWQNQLKEKTVQGEIELALSKIFKNNSMSIIGSGRTDSGVHALNQVANFSVNTSMTELQIKRAINSYLNNDIYIISCTIVDSKFHSRFSAKKREYVYHISSIYSPFKRKYKWYLKFDIDMDKLIDCSKLLTGKHDFSQFCKTSSRKKNNECNVSVSKWNFDNEQISYNIVSDRFLHHMVRLLVGTMIEVAKDRIIVDDFKKMIENLPCNISPVRAPSKGLFLVNVFY